MSLLTLIQQVLNIQRTIPEDPRRRTVIPVGRRKAGVRITHENAQQISAVFRAVAYISESIMSLPWRVHRIQEDGSTVITPNTTDFIINNQANNEVGASTWRETMLSYALRWGNGYAEIVRNQFGEVIGLGHPLHPVQVYPSRDERTNALLYTVINDGAMVDIPYQDMFHLRGRGNGIVGESVVGHACRSLSIAAAQEENVASFFGNNNQAGGVLTHPGHLSDNAKDKLTKYINEQLKGPESAYSMLIVEEGMTWKPTSMPNEDSQMMEAREFSVQEIARWFGLPPHILMDYGRATWGNLEQASTEAVRSGLMPWVVRLESEANTKLLQGRNRLSRTAATKIDLKGLLRADTATRNQAYALGRQWGWLSANDVRAKEDMSPIEGGDIYLTPMNMTGVGSTDGAPREDGADVSATVDKLIESSKKNSSDTKERIDKSLRILLHDVCARIVSRETNQIRQFSTRDEFGPWFEKWAVKHGEYTKSALEPMVTSYLLATNEKRLPAVDVDAMVGGYIDNMRHSVRIATDNGLLGDYCDSRDVFIASLEDEWFMTIVNED